MSPTPRESAVCAVCGAKNPVPLLSSRDQDGVDAEPFEIVRCASCGLAYVDPRPPASDLGRFYNREYFRKPSPLLSGLVSGVIGLLMRARAAKLVRWKASGRILDVGCGSGSFLAEFKSLGWDCWGIEVSPDAAALARDRGLTVRDRPFMECGLPEGHFDLVTLWHSVEHLPDPAGYLREARRVLKGDGILFLAFPNGAGWEFGLFGEKWFHLDPPRHLNYFSPQTLGRLLRTVGFQLEEVNPYCWEYVPFGFYQSVLNLFSTEMNFIYKVLKGVGMRHLGRAGWGWNLAVAAVLSPVAAPASFLWGLLSGAAGKSGCVEIYARKD